MATFTGSRFVHEAYQGLDGVQHPGVVLHIARARQVVFLGFVVLVDVVAFAAALSPWAARAWFGLGPWILGGLAVGGVLYVLVGGRWWFEPPIVAMSDRGILIRAFGGATMVPWRAVTGVTLDTTRRRPVLRLALAPNAAVELRGRHRIEAPYASRRSLRVPAAMFRATPQEIEAQIRAHWHAAQSNFAAADAAGLT